jgi:hypothetical protein
MVGVVILLLTVVATAQPSRPAIGASYAARIRDLSEPGGLFDTDNLISNESSYLDVLPALAEARVSGGAYVGVGPDQNFSYIARIRPTVAFIIDIRRDNLLLHLLFKAIFAEAPSRVAYLSLLTGRAPPAATRRWTDAPLVEILDSIDQAERQVPSELPHRLESRINSFGVPLSPEDFDTIRRFHAAFAAAGLNLRFRSHGRPPQPYYPTFRQLLLATDSAGRPGSYLATEESYAFVRDLQARDAIIPVVGDISGPHALRAIGAMLAGDGVALSAFYTSNVEDYLFRAGSFGRYVDNLSRLPRTPRTVVIRSVFRGGPSVSLVQRLEELLSGAAHGGFRSYIDLVYGDRR